MLAKSFSALAVLALTANVAAEPLRPYQPQVMKMSVRQLFGVVRRDDKNPGYQPEEAFCGAGNNCQEACGDGYTTCASKDSEIHCFNPSAQQTCCPNGAGDSCEAGYYCASDKKQGTWCCPDAMDLEACAAAYEVKGGLTAQTPPSPSSSAPASTSSAPASSSAPAVSSSSSAVVSSSASVDSTSTAWSSQSSSYSAPSASFSLPASNSTSATFSATGAPSAPAEPSASAPATAGGAMVLPSTLLLAAAGLIAALL